MKANQAMHQVRTMCRMLGVSPSGYYAWRGREPSARSKADEELKARIAAIHKHSRGTYGVCRGCMRSSRRRGNGWAPSAWLG